jgi:hypothetical protein
MFTLPPDVEAPGIPGHVARDNDSNDEKRRRIAEIAYTLAVRRGFDGDSDEALEDWLTATEMVDQPAPAARRSDRGQT